MSALEETIKETIHAHDQMLKRLWCIAYEEGQKAEREACANVCEEIINEETVYVWIPDAKSAVNDCAAAIRARGKK